MSFSKRFGENVAAARKRSGLSQEALQFRSSVHRTVISKVERGETIPRADTVARLAAGIGVDPGVFFAGLDPERCR
ncbi:MAG TPA: helix-turn-helix transcriptional regulator [Solirubrobacterales bacterium]|jgi:transcriptional regulator with XRE-family HTH domain